MPSGRWGYSLRSGHARGAAAPGLAFVLLAVALLAPATARADEGWRMEGFHAEMAIQPDASLVVAETIQVDFRMQRRSGILREYQVRSDYDAEWYRVYNLDMLKVTDLNVRSVQFTVSQDGPSLLVRIGDPGRMISGKQIYRLTYRVSHALSSRDEHDLLAWNVVGAPSAVPIERATAAVLRPRGELERVACFQGPADSLEPCIATLAPERAEFASTRPLAPGEGLTIVAAIRKGVVPVAPPRLEPRPRALPATPTLVGAALLVLLAGLAAVARPWRARAKDGRAAPPDRPRSLPPAPAAEPYAWLRRRVPPSS